jgi:hypothetical protein
MADGQWALRAASTSPQKRAPPAFSFSLDVGLWYELLMQPQSDDSELLERVDRNFLRVNRLFGRMRFLLAPTVEQCLIMVGQLEAEFGGERRAVAFIGPSLISVRSWKRRKRMSIPSRRLVWLVWALVLHPETLQGPGDLVTWGRTCWRA